MGTKKVDRKVIVHIHDNALRIGEAFELLSKMEYDSTWFERYCAWRMHDGHCISADIGKNKNSIRFDIWKERVWKPTK